MTNGNKCWFHIILHFACIWEKTHCHCMAIPLLKVQTLFGKSQSIIITREQTNNSMTSPCPAPPAPPRWPAAWRCSHVWLSPEPVTPSSWSGPLEHGAWQHGRVWGQLSTNIPVPTVPAWTHLKLSHLDFLRSHVAQLVESLDCHSLAIMFVDSLQPITCQLVKHNWEYAWKKQNPNHKGFKMGGTKLKKWISSCLFPMSVSINFPCVLSRNKIWLDVSWG